jgi:hypothetical protein
LEIEKEKGISLPPVGPFPAQAPPLSRARSSPPPEAQLGPPPARARAALTASPTHQPRSPSLPRDRPLSGRRAPLVSPFPLAHDQAIGTFVVGHCPPRRLAINALASSVWRLVSPRTVPESSRRHCLPEPSRRHCVPSSPPRQASPVLATSPHRPPIKGPPRAPYFTAPGLSHSIFLPWTQSSSTSSSLPSPVSSALPSLVAYGQIALALKLSHCATSLSHTSSSPIAPGSPTGDLTAMGARHLAVDRPSRASTGQIDPATMTPYIWPH